MPTDSLPRTVPINTLAFLLEQHYGLTSHTALHAAHLLAAKRTLRVSSGRRTPERNREVGGAPRSYHLRGRAVDFVGPLRDLVDARALATRQRVTPWCTGPEEVLLENPGRRGQHLHVAW